MLRLGSVIEYGFGPNTGAISLIYSHLLEKYKVNLKTNILINHIGNDLIEQIISQKNQVGINIQYPLPDNFNELEAGKNHFFISIIHEALLRLAKEKTQIDINKIEAIRKEILDKDFCFNIPYKSYLNKKDKNRLAIIFIKPDLSKFDFFVSIEENGKEACKLLIYSGKPTDFYVDDLFNSGKWKSINEFVITGKRSEMEIHVFQDDCSLEFVNTSGNTAKAPIFELFKSDANKAQTLQDYINSLNPAIAAVIRESSN